jgi:cysteine synthase B
MSTALPIQRPSAIDHRPSAIDHRPSPIDHRPSDIGSPPSVLDLIGNTPLVRLPSLETSGSRIYAKLEWQNPGGSVKDRAAARMIAEGERSGALEPGGTILDATSGNTGIAYAMIGAARGYRVRLCVPANVTPERLRMLRAFGAEVVLTDPMEGSDGAIREARAIHAREPRLFYPDQYNNSANWRAHYDTTAGEIWEQTAGTVTHFVAGLGTSGTFIGTTRRLRELNPRIRAVSMQPDSPLHGLEGLKHMASSIVPGIYDARVADADVRVTTEDALAMTRRLAAHLGLFAGISSGAAAVAAAGVAASAPGSVVVTVFPDGGARYLSERFWEEEA